MAEIQVAVFTDAGTRDHNEDACGYGAQDGRACFVVADGLGGHDKGEVASHAAVDYIMEHFRKWNVVQKKAFLRFLKGRIRQCGNVRKSVRICGRQWRPHSLKMADSGTFMREIPGAII